VFATCDTNNNGFLEATELKRFFDALELPIPEKYKSSLFEQLDAEGDGDVTQDDFETGT